MFSIFFTFTRSPIYRHLQVISPDDLLLVFCLAARASSTARAEALVRFAYFTLYLFLRALEGALAYDLMLDSDAFKH